MSKGEWVTEVAYRAFRLTDDGLLRGDNGEFPPYRESTWNCDTVEDAIANGERAFSGGEVVILTIAARRFVYTEESK